MISYSCVHFFSYVINQLDYLRMVFSSSSVLFRETKSYMNRDDYLIDAFWTIKKAKKNQDSNFFCFTSIRLIKSVDELSLAVSLLPNLDVSFLKLVLNAGLPTEAVFPFEVIVVAVLDASDEERAMEIEPILFEEEAFDMFMSSFSSLSLPRVV